MAVFFPMTRVFLQNIEKQIHSNLELVKLVNISYLVTLVTVGLIQIRLHSLQISEE